MNNFYPYLHRTLCDILEEMRKCYDTRNFSHILGLIEEAQSMANRMEASLDDKRDIKEWTKLRDKLKKEIRELENKKDK